MIFPVVTEHCWPPIVTLSSSNTGHELALAIWGTGDNQDIPYQHVSQPYHHRMVSPGRLFDISFRKSGQELTVADKFITPIRLCFNIVF